MLSSLFSGCSHSQNDCKVSIIKALTQMPIIETSNSVTFVFLQLHCGSYFLHKSHVIQFLNLSHLFVNKAYCFSRQTSFKYEFFFSLKDFYRRSISYGNTQFSILSIVRYLGSRLSWHLASQSGMHFHLIFIVVY